MKMHIQSIKGIKANCHRKYNNGLLYYLKRDNLNLVFLIKKR